MAVITPTALAYNTVSADAAIADGTAIVHGNTDTILYPIEGDLVVQMNNSTASAETITFNAGFGLAAGVGSLDVAFVQDDVKYIVLSSDRFKNADGQLSIDYSTGMTGYVQAFTMPK